MFLVFLICLVRRLLERPLLVFYLRIRTKINVSEHQENDARNGFCGCVGNVFRVSCINAKPYREQGWEEKIAEHP